MYMCIQAGNIGANDGGPKATDSDPKATGGDPAAIGVIQGTHPDVAPLLNKFTCFGYQIASGMVSTRLMFIHQLHNSVIKSLKQQQLSHTSSVFYSCVL